jgi:diguanylate cyclase (GGDEF)-like protein
MAEAGTNSGEILIICDEASPVRDIRAVLERLGYPDVGIAHTLAQTQDLVERSRPGLIFCETRFAEDGVGLDLARDLRDELGIPLILLSDSPAGEALDQALAISPQGYLVLPVQDQELEIAIELARVRHRAEKSLLESADRLESRLREYESQIEQSAYYDSLTGLPNRTLFIDRVTDAIQRTQAHDGHRFAVLFLDLDRFRAINEGLGHGMGDQLLVEVSRRLEDITNPADTLSRFGGDTFALLLENCQSLNEVVVTCENIQEEFDEVFQVDDRPIDISCSIGIVLSQKSYENADDMLRDADTAMHRAKDDGRGRHTVFDRGMYADAIRYIEWGDDMKRALEERGFEMYYQPIVDARAGKLHSLEALIRWPSGKHDQLSPADFIPVAEESGLILPVGGWVLESVCEQIAFWRNEYRIELKVEVNLSGVQFGQADLVAKIRGVLERKGVPARLLGLEITEGVAMRDVELSIATLEELRKLGLSVSIDDFGTGYSSLAYLKRYPISMLKIDRSFVQDITSNKSDLAITSSIIALARALEIDVLAEGVETLEQLELLLRSGCRIMQGHYFSPALSGKDIIPYLEKEQLLASPDKSGRYIV